jgi:HK97 gp10 family phage protein
MANSTIVGFEELKRKLEKLGASVAKEKVLTAVQAGALLIENQAKSNAPVVTGTLRRSIHHETADTNSDTAAVDIGTDLVYARRIEFGFSGRDSLGRLYNQAPNPYLRSAAESKKEEAIREAAAALKDLVTAAVR